MRISISAVRKDHMTYFLVVNMNYPNPCTKMIWIGQVKVTYLPQWCVSGWNCCQHGIQAKLLTHYLKLEFGFRKSSTLTNFTFVFISKVSFNTCHTNDVLLRLNKTNLENQVTRNTRWCRRTQVLLERANLERPRTQHNVQIVLWIQSFHSLFFIEYQEI